jgi:alpha-glucosidase
MAESPAPDWWRRGVLYQIYPRSYQDSGGDGIGDLQGITQRLDHLQWLGIDGVWLNPTFPSPNADWGYDVADYRGVHPDLGTLADLEELVAQARERGIAVLLDLVPNHSSEAHPWFVDARGGRDAEFREYYVWADPGPGGGPPNNWRSMFGGPAWELDEASGQYYLHNFLPQQPDLNWWSDRVRAEFDDILRFWYERGVAGFRIDACQGLVHDRELRDDPAPPDDAPERLRAQGTLQVYSMNRPEVHDVLKHWRTLDPSRVLMGETATHDPALLAPFYGDGDELHLAFNFFLMESRFAAAELRAVVDAWERDLPEFAWPVYAGSNHDGGRMATRWAGGDPARVRAALVMLLTLRGTPVLYAGDEIGLLDVPQDPQTAKDPVARRTGRPADNRDVCRTPMPWEGEGHAGFCPDDVEPWLPLGPLEGVNVAAQREDPASVLHLTRDLVALRAAREDLATGAFASLPAPEGVWAYRRGADTVVALNLTGSPARVSGVSGRVLLAADRSLDGSRAVASLSLAPWAAVVVGERG